MPPGFWELRDGVEVTGATVHWIDEGLDTGDIIAQKAVQIPEYATPAGLRVMLDVCGTEVLLDAIERIDQNQVDAVSQQITEDKPNRAPSWLLAQHVQRLARMKRSPPKSLRRCLRNAAKNAILALFVYAWVPLRNGIRSLWGRSHVAVMLYHRVDDSLHDTVTVGVEQFSRQLSVIARRYDVLDMKTFLMGRGRPRKRPAVVITFDDGYACNYLAAVVLRRAGLPCTFFLSTGMIGTERPFRHDIERLGRRVPSLTWRQVERMVEWGFDFGPHTVGHVRLSDLPQDKALKEIEAASECLERQLRPEKPITWFAYPYGKKDDIRSETKEFLPSIGIEYCFSAYGGTNGPDWNPMNILRTGVDASFSGLAFRAAIEGW
jgi:peptidoglycan/xylan/chitin deacetylase (PgdA/CDA1 family)